MMMTTKHDRERQERDEAERELDEMRDARPTHRPEEDGPDWGKLWNDTSAE